MSFSTTISSVLMKGRVNTFDDLPLVASTQGHFYVVQATQGGIFNKRYGGIYFSNGTTWNYLGENVDYITPEEVSDPLASDSPDPKLCAPVDAYNIAILARDTEPLISANDIVDAQGRVDTKRIYPDAIFSILTTEVDIRLPNGAIPLPTGTHDLYDGVYYIDDDWLVEGEYTIKGRVIIDGHGKRIMYDNSPAIQMGSPSNLGGAVHFEVRNCIIDCTDIIGGAAVRFQTGHGTAIFRNCQFLNAGYQLHYATTGTDVQFIGCQFKQRWALNRQEPMFFIEAVKQYVGAPETTSIGFRNCRFESWSIGENIMEFLGGGAAGAFSHINIEGCVVYYPEGSANTAEFIYVYGTGDGLMTDEGIFSISNLTLHNSNTYEIILSSGSGKWDKLQMSGTRLLYKFLSLYKIDGFNWTGNKINGSNVTEPVERTLSTNNWYTGQPKV